VRWAAAEGVPEIVIATVRLLHQRNVDEIVPALGATLWAAKSKQRLFVKRSRD